MFTAGAGFFLEMADFGDISQARPPSTGRGARRAFRLGLLRGNRGLNSRTKSSGKITEGGGNRAILEDLDQAKAASRHALVDLHCWHTRSPGQALVKEVPHIRHLRRFFS